MQKVSTQKVLLLFLFTTLYSFYSYGQNISGIINNYTAVANIGAANLTVVSSAGFTVGGKVLIIEMQGATIDQTNTSNFGNITSYGNAGNYEFDTISAIAGNVISFKNNLSVVFDVAGNVQLITVPVYNNATVTGTLTCQPWNNSTGGVLVFQVMCTLTMNANIDVSNLGFTGGNFESDGGNFSCTAASYFTSSSPAFGDGGQKGESISEYITNGDGSMGKQANGGGGGNPGNSGGGGGGSFGAGGLGGYEYSGCNSTSIFGYGGLALSNAGNKIFMGGGGGGGLADNGQAVTAGGNGGAIVYVIANTLVGNTNSIVDTGQSVTQYSSDESSGGGGAGGSVILSVLNYTAPVTVNTKGGYGGSSYNHIFTGQCHGPGGGGGGGLLITSGTSLSPNITYIDNGGASGLVLNPSSSCYNTSFGAAAGGAGGVINLPSIAAHIGFLNLGNDTTLCPGKSVVLNAGNDFASYLWQNNTTDSTLTASATGKYYVTVLDSLGCTESDTVLVTVEKPIMFNIGNDTSVCMGSSVLLQAPTGYASYLWQNGSTLNTFKTGSAGTYYVTVTDTLGCMGADTSTVKIYPKDSINLGNPVICQGQSVVLNAGSGFASYLWQDGSTGSTFIVKDSGSYYVQVTNIHGCSISDTVHIAFHPPLILNLGNNILSCTIQPVLLHAGSDFVSYLWQDGSTDSTLTANDTGKYTVRVINNNGCVGADSINISLYPQVVIYLGNDTAVCPGDTVTLDAGAGLNSYLWQDGSASETYTATQPGKYYVSAQNSSGCSGSDTLNVLPFLPEPPSNLIRDTTICNGTPITLNGPSGYLQYIWNGFYHAADFQVSFPGTVTLKVTNEQGCSNTSTATVTELCPPTIYFPNAFSPNGDGNNDIYKPIGSEITAFHIQIFDRWGELVFESSQMDKGWDGTYKSMPCSVGTYVYVATYTGQVEAITKSGTVKGNITLIR